jgi:hypothetical protein
MEKQTMNREDVDKVTLGEMEPGGLRIPVEGLPPHLQAHISVGQGRFQFTLERKGDVRPYVQNPHCGTPDAALKALQKLLTWDPVA